MFYPRSKSACMCESLSNSHLYFRAGVFKKIWIDAFNVFMIFWVTLSLFPGADAILVTPQNIDTNLFSTILIVSIHSRVLINSLLAYLPNRRLDRKNGSATLCCTLEAISRRFSARPPPLLPALHPGCPPSIPRFVWKLAPDRHHDRFLVVKWLFLNFVHDVGAQSRIRQRTTSGRNHDGTLPSSQPTTRNESPRVEIIR